MNTFGITITYGISYKNPLSNKQNMVIDDKFSIYFQNSSIDRVDICIDVRSESGSCPRSDLCTIDCYTLRDSQLGK